MDPVLDIWIPLAPKGKGRPLFRTIPRPDAPFIEAEDLATEKIKKHYAMGNMRPQAYGETTTEYEKEVRKFIIREAAYKDDFRTLSGGVTCDWVAFFPPVMSNTRRMKEAKVRGLVEHISKPDKDNIEKLILDAMSEVVFIDDCQVNFGTSAKIYSHREGIRARIYRTNIEEVNKWVEENFPFQEEEFTLTGS